MYRYAWCPPGICVKCKTLARHKESQRPLMWRAQAHWPHVSCCTMAGQLQSSIPPHACQHQRASALVSKHCQGRQYSGPADHVPRSRSCQLAAGSASGCLRLPVLPAPSQSPPCCHHRQTRAAHASPWSSAASDALHHWSKIWNSLSMLTNFVIMNKMIVICEYRDIVHGVRGMPATLLKAVPPLKTTRDGPSSEAFSEVWLVRMSMLDACGPSMGIEGEPFDSSLIWPPVGQKGDLLGTPSSRACKTSSCFSNTESQLLAYLHLHDSAVLACDALSWSSGVYAACELQAAEHSVHWHHSTMKWGILSTILSCSSACAQHDCLRGNRSVTDWLTTGSLLQPGYKVSGTRSFLKSFQEWTKGSPRGFHAFQRLRRHVEACRGDTLSTRWGDSFPVDDTKASFAFIFSKWCLLQAVPVSCDYCQW